MSLDSKVFQGVTDFLSKEGIDYFATGESEPFTSHLFVEMDNDFSSEVSYSLEVCDYEDGVEVYAFYTHNGDEVAYFKQTYKTIGGACRRIVKLIEELTD